MENEIEKEQKRITDAMRDINLAYWSILIAINGIIISVLSIIAILKNINILFVLSIPSIISCMIIISNFQITRFQYNTIMDRLLKPENKKDNDVQQANKAYKMVEKNTEIVLNLIFLQIIFILLFSLFRVITN